MSGERNVNGISAGGASRWSKLQNAVLTQNHLRTPPISPHAIAVYCALLVHADGQGRCFPCQRRLGEMSNMSLRQVTRAIAELVSANLLTKTGDARSGKRLSYTIQQMSEPTPDSRRSETEPTPDRRTPGEEPTPDSRRSEQPTPDSRRGYATQSYLPTPDRRTELEPIELEPVNKNNPPAPKGESSDSLSLIPESLDTAEFRIAWQEWLGFRSERKPKVTPRSAKMALKKLEQFGPARAVAAIETSIANGYQGLFEPGGNGNGRNGAGLGPNRARVYAEPGKYDGVGVVAGAGQAPTASGAKHPPSADGPPEPR